MVSNARIKVNLIKKIFEKLIHQFNLDLRIIDHQDSIL